MNFLTEPVPPRGVAVPIAPGIRRLTAANPGPMTYRGTNTYLLDWPGGVAVLDPGPDDAEHVAAIQSAAGSPIVAIVLTHGHHDHFGALPALRAATGAPVHAFHRPADPAIAPDVPLADGDMVGPWRAVHTPGHAPDHLCFVGPDGLVFSGDHVMGWSTTVVTLPSGDMSAYFDSLERLLPLGADRFLPGHGPPIPEPISYVRALLAHRQARERGILAQLGPAPQTAAALVARVYPDLTPDLRGAAERNVVAHLGKLVAEGRAEATEAGWSAVS